MKKYAIVAGVLLVAAIAYAQARDFDGRTAINGSANIGSKTTESLVLASAATAVPATGLAKRRAIEIQNIGPNPIYCRCDGTAPVVKKARKISNGDVWAQDCDENACVCKCIAETADQVTTAATIVTELR